ncbi:MAG TPA: preprotein translocase subunit YajC [Novosphingobium sp.]|nr:preprotein translocase subunit YajC [Novosphingobium sp.]
MLRAFLALLALVGLSVPAVARDRHDAQGEGPHKRRTADGARTSIRPYLEVGQVLIAELEPGNEVLTYSTVAAGVDASIHGRNTQGQVSVRYERRIGWGDNQADGDVVSGLARVASAVVPGKLQIDAGALAARTRIESSGGASLNPLGNGRDSVSQLYSFYAGPTLTTRLDNVALNASYQVGYTRLEAPNSVQLAPGQPRVDVFDDSLTQAAIVSAGVRPGELADFGVTASTGWAREDISNLDQRVDQKYLREDFVLPVSLDVALLAGVGYEDVEISSRDARRDGAGNPVIGRDGRFVTDKSAPRRLAYDVDGLIWDAGVMWRPSKRTALEAHVGRRYDSTSYYGSFAYAPDVRTAINVSVYDSVSGFGGQLRRALDDLPTDFAVSRNPLSGDLNGCIVARAGGGCLNDVLSSVASATFRARGIGASYAHDFGRLQAGVAAGYDRRKFLAARGTVLALANGVVDETVWANAYLAGRIDQQSSFNVNVYANWFQSGFAGAGDATALGANASYFRRLTDRLSATAAVGIDGVERDDPLIDQWTASALVGLRYSL